MQLSSHYKTGLGKPFLAHARALFLVFFIVFIGVSACTVYAGIVSGEFDRRFVTPLHEMMGEADRSLGE